MKTALKSLASTAMLAALVGGAPSAARAVTLEPLGDGALPSGNHVEYVQVTIGPGESIPWHYHPGLVYAVILSGVLTEEHGCGAPADTFTVGSAFSERRGVIHRVFNYGSNPVIVLVTFIVPARNANYFELQVLAPNGPKCDD
jgi:quercetin dioxygenase-like cupin family protein